MKLRPWTSLLIACGCAGLLLLLWQREVIADTPPPTESYLPPDTYAGVCAPWEQVNDAAFGLDSGSTGIPYLNEDSGEAVVFQDRLYLGMEADNSLGARLWRTGAGVHHPVSQADWEEVAEDAGWPFGNPLSETIVQDGITVYQNDHVDSLAVFQDVLYASTSSGEETSLGTLVYSSATGAAGSWSPVTSAGFGDTDNVNFTDMQEFQGWLCGGTQNWTTGAQVWCTQDGATWAQKNYGGFGASGNYSPVVAVWSGHVYSDALYFGVQERVGTVEYSGHIAKLYRTTDLDLATPTWTPVYTSELNAYRLHILGDLDGYLYIAHRPGPTGLRILRSASGDPGSWTQVNEDAMGGTGCTGTVVDGATVYNGALYVALSNESYEAAEVWRTTGTLQPGGLVDWEPVGGAGLDNGDNLHAQLTVYHGMLYAWTSNYFGGQQVLRTSCPLCQARVITDTGRFEFAGVGATLDFSSEGLDVVTVCVKPRMLPTAQRAPLPLLRSYEITATPGGASFVADVTLTYLPEELALSGADEDDVRLYRWAGSAWVECAGSTSDPGARSVTCPAVSAFSTWALGSAAAQPTVVRLAQAGASPVWGLPALLVALVFLVQRAARAATTNRRW